MADGDDTQVLPAGDAGQGTEPGAGEGTETELGAGGDDDIGAGEGTPPPPPPPPTPEEIEERAFQRTASWMGRREKELSDTILRNVTQVLDSRLSQMHPAALPPGTDPATMLENPDAWARTVVPKILDEVVSQRTRADQSYMSDFIRHAGTIMDGDSLFSGEEGKKLGSEVVAEIQKNIGNLDRRFPAEDAARLVIANSALSVVRQRSFARQNALAGNRPATGIGTIKAPGAPAAGKPAPIKLDDMAKKVANWFGNTEEEVRNFLK
uniref:Uncharacterized protein n=1 Tax=viral metagenome TaxID=1070528 RepID=A0A6M3KBN0_9ZZZZ